MSFNDNPKLEMKRDCFCCGISVDVRSLFITEIGNAFCLSCWMKKAQNRFTERRLTIVEL